MAEPEKEKLILEKDFIPLISEFTGDFFKHVNLITQKPPNTWVKRYYAILSEKAHNLESYLDDHRARDNKAFSFITEIFASIRWFSEKGPLTKEEVADNVIHILFDGVIKTKNI